MKTLLSASALALLVATPVAAQQADRNAPAVNRSATVETRTDAKPAATVQPPGTIDGEKLIGRNIKNPDGDTIGEVSSVLIGRDGKIEAVIVGVGGFLGIGQRDVAIDWDELEIRDNGQTVLASMTKDQLKALPEFRYAEDVNRERERMAARNGAAPNMAAPSMAGRTTTDARTPTDMRTAATGAQVRAENRDAAPAARTDNTTTVAVVAVPVEIDPKLGNMRAEQLIGKDVVNAQGDTVGEIEDIVIDKSSNKAVHAVVSVGGFLGIGDKDVAIPFSELRMGQDNAILMSQATEEQLKQLPAYKKDDRWGPYDRDRPIMDR